MNPAAFQTLYDLATQAPPNRGLLLGSALALPLLLGLWGWRRRRGQPLLLTGFFAFVAGLALTGCLLSEHEHRRLAVALREGRTLVAEGPLQGHAVERREHYDSVNKRRSVSVAESFVVGAVDFGFVRDATVPGFTNSGDEPLAFVPGERLRVHYVELVPGDFSARRIVRLERALPALAAR